MISPEPRVQSRTPCRASLAHENVFVTKCFIFRSKTCISQHLLQSSLLNLVPGVFNCDAKSYFWQCLKPLSLQSNDCNKKKKTHSQKNGMQLIIQLNLSWFITIGQKIQRLWSMDHVHIAHPKTCNNSWPTGLNVEFLKGQVSCNTYILAVMVLACPRWALARWISLKETKKGEKILRIQMEGSTARDLTQQEKDVNHELNQWQ